MKKQAKKQNVVMPMQDLATLYRSLPVDEQQAIVNYFNLHNAAIWIYSKLSDKALEYVSEAIKASRTSALLEKQAKEAKK